MLVGGSLNMQGNLHRRLVLGSWKMGRSPHLPARILRVYTEALMRLNHVSSSYGVNNARLCPWSSYCVGTMGGTHIPRTEEVVRSLQVSGSSARVNWKSCPLSDLCQHCCHCFQGYCWHLSSLSSTTYPRLSSSSSSISDGIGGLPDRISQTLPPEPLIIMSLSACSYYTHPFPIETGHAYAKWCTVYHLSAKHIPLSSPTLLYSDNPISTWWSHLLTLPIRKHFDSWFPGTRNPQLEL